MKRQTKKGPRRSRAMPVSSKRFVVTDYDGCEYITAGKRYLVKYYDRHGETVIDDAGDEIDICTPKWKWCGCAHLDDRKWSWATL